MSLQLDEIKTGSGKVAAAMWNQSCTLIHAGMALFNTQQTAPKSFFTTNSWLKENQLDFIEVDGEKKVIS